MGRKEYLQKELDFLLEKLRFWRYVIFAIVSGVVGVLFALSQKKIEGNSTILILLLLAFLGILLSISRINALTQEYKYYLELLKKEE